MNDRPEITDRGDDWLDGGREHRAEYLDDTGFTARAICTARLAQAGAGRALDDRRTGVAAAMPAVVTDVAHEVLRVLRASRFRGPGLPPGRRAGCRHLGGRCARVARGTEAPDPLPGSRR